MCDATGHGKTRTVLELIRYDWNNNAHTRPTLVIASPSIVTQWSLECAKWIPDIPVFVMYGQGYAKKLDQLKTTKYAIILSTPSTFIQYIRPLSPSVPCTG